MLPKRTAYLTKLFILSWVVIFVLDVTIFTKATNVTEWLSTILWNSHGKLNDLLALIPSRVFNHGYWRIIMYSFTHSGLLHLGGNILLISFVGNILESRIESADFIVPVLLGNIIAGIGCMLFVNSNSAYIIGSSPGIYALYGVLTANLFFRKINSSMYMSSTTRNRIIIILLLANFLGLDTFVIHMIGFIIGLLCGYFQSQYNHSFD